MNSMQPIRIVTLFFLFTFVLLGANACSGDDNPASSGNPSPAPGKHKVVYEVTGTDRAQVSIDWVDNNGREISETVRIPMTRETSRSDGERVGLRVKYQAASVIIVRAKIFVDGSEWASDADAGNLLQLEIGGTL